ncbi:MAG: dihydroorotate dehydrogenase B catalytic subunit [Planctomycetota bacterium]|nr:MAG: dihydroorotate dehydrogenase B catalytic subunit [Planctomycetota bacterium]
MDLTVELCPGLRLANPVLSASGTWGAGLEAARFADVSGIGGIVTKTVTPKPRAGNPPTRLAETPSGMLNSIGLENPGVDAFLQGDFQDSLQLGPPVILNVGGESFEEFEQIIERVQGCGAAALELNLSCPNVQGGALPFSTDPVACEKIVASCVSRSELPIFVKLSPNVTRITELAQAAEQGGADGLTLINTLLGMAVDWRRRRPVLGLSIGGLSGPAIKPVALRCIWQVRQVCSLPILGVGGASSGSDVLEFLLAGADAVQIGTANFGDPLAPVHIVEELRGLLAENGQELSVYRRGLHRQGAEG